MGLERGRDSGFADAGRVWLVLSARNVGGAPPETVASLLSALVGQAPPYKERKRQSKSLQLRLQHATLICGYVFFSLPPFRTFGRGCILSRKHSQKVLLGSFLNIALHTSGWLARLGSLLGRERLGQPLNVPWAGNWQLISEQCLRSRERYLRTNGARLSSRIRI